LKANIPYFFKRLNNLNQEWLKEEGKIFKTWAKKRQDRPYYDKTLDLCNNIIGMWKA